MINDAMQKRTLYAGPAPDGAYTFVGHLELYSKLG